MAVAYINQCIRAINMDEVKAYLSSATRDEDDLGFEVCAVIKADWSRYVRSENQALRSRTMLWVDGKVYIVELPTAVHESAIYFFMKLMERAIGTEDRHLQP